MIAHAPTRLRVAKARGPGVVQGGVEERPGDPVVFVRRDHDDGADVDGPQKRAPLGGQRIRHALGDGVAGELDEVVVHFLV